MLLHPNRIRVWWLWLKLKRQLRNQLQPEHAQHWIEFGMLLITFAMLIANYLRFWWMLSQIYDPR